MRKFSIRLAAACLIFVLCLALLEGLCTTWCVWKYGTASTYKLNAIDVPNTYVANQQNAWAETIVPDGYLEIRQNENMPGTNKIGFISPDFPFMKDPNKFTILLTGGSVTQQLLETGHLNRMLEKLDFGKPLLLLSTATGGTLQPRQAIAAMMFGEIADAVISLDGYNEHWSMLGTGPRLESPTPAFEALNPILADGYDRLGKSWECNRLRRFSKNTNSRFVFLVTKTLRERIESSAQAEGLGLQALRERYLLPRTWSKTERSEFNIGQFAKYVRSVDAIGAANGFRTVHFVQPCPAISKPLTPKEKDLIGKRTYDDVYQHMTDELLALNKGGSHVVSLLDVFKNETGEIYKDHCHCNARGYELIATRIARELAQLWNIPNKT